MGDLPEFHAEEFEARNPIDAASVVFGSDDFYLVGSRKVGTPGPIRILALLPTESLATAFAMFLSGEDGADAIKQGFDIMAMKFEAEDA